MCARWSSAATSCRVTADRTIRDDVFTSGGRRRTFATFKVTSPPVAPKIRLVELANQTITAERMVQIGAASGWVEANSGADFLKVAMFDRHYHSPQVAFGSQRN